MEKERKAEPEGHFEPNLMYCSVKGIVGNSIGSIKTLELPGVEEAESDED